MAGATAALQLVPVAAFMVDEFGALLGCNDPFEQITLVPHEILLGREWWQAFAARSAEASRAMHEGVVRSSEPRGECTLELFRGDGAALRVSLRWLRVTEPGTRRALWVYAAHELPTLDASPSRVTQGALSDAELLGLVSLELVEIAEAFAHRNTEGLGARVERLARNLLAHGQRGASAASVADLIKRAVSAALSDPARPVRLEVETQASVRAWPVDPARALALVVEHARARSAGKPVRVRIFDRPQVVCFEVLDAGAPIDAGLQSRVLARTQFERDVDTLHPLEIAAALVRALGGQFELESSLSQGMLVRFTLPLR
jgi:signal transduction histidine kinase